MRKYLIVCLTLVLFIALYYISASYYMSLQVQSKIENIVQNYQDAKKNLTINLKYYNRGVFTSKAKLMVQYDNFSPFDIDLKIVHRPLLYYKDDLGKFTVHYNKLLISSTISQEFLEKQTKLLQNISIVDPYGEIRIKFHLHNMTKMLYELLGFYSNDNDLKHADANAEISFNEDGLSILLSGQSEHLISENSIYKADSSQFKILLHFLVEETAGDNWSNNYKIELQANNFTSINSDIADVILSNPNLKLDLTGDFFYFLDAIKLQKNLTDLILEQQPIKINVSVDNKRTQIINSDKEQIQVNDFNFDFNLDNSKKHKQINSNLNWSNLIVQSATDNFNVGSLALKFDVELDGELFDKNFRAHPLCLLSLTGLMSNKCLPGSFRPTNLNLNLDVNNIFSTGLLSGQFNLNHLNVNFDLQQATNKDLIINNKVDVNTLNWILNAGNDLKIRLHNAHFNFDGSLNITEYIAGLLKKNHEPYNATYIYNVSIPEFELSIGQYGLSLSQLIGSGDFLLNRDIKGYLHNNLDVKSLNFNTGKSKTNFANLQLLSAMTQKHKFILTGTSHITASVIDSNIFNNNLVVDNLDYINTSTLNNAQLSYDNVLHLQEVKSGDTNYGQVDIKNKVSELILDDYQGFLSTLNYIFLDQILVNKFSKNQQNDKILEAIVNFLITGLRADNKIQIGNIDNNLKIYNIVRLKNMKAVATTATTNTDINTELELLDDKIDKIMKNANGAFNIIVNKEYLEKMLKLIDLHEVNDFYNNMQKIGLLDYKDANLANIKILYVDNKIIINGQNLDLWQKKLQKRK